MMPEYTGQNFLSRFSETLNKNRRTFDSSILNQCFISVTSEHIKQMFSRDTLKWNIGLK